MSNGFISLYLDEDVNVLVSVLVQAKGFNTIAARDADQLRISDAAQVTDAASQGRT